MQAGALNRRIIIQKKQMSRDADGYPAEIWVTQSVRWAQVLTTGGGEFYAAQRVNAETTAVFKTRYVQGINTGMRIKYGERIFDILSISDTDGQRKELSISAKEIV
jgi:SPP1 family predicted phage head-tail adaptor